MKKSILLLIVFAASFCFARSSDEERVLAVKDSLAKVKLANLQRETDALERIRLEKADALEKKEAEHWRNRYKENNLSEEHENDSRELEGRYSELSSDLSRLSEELTSSKTETENAKSKADAALSAMNSLNDQVTDAISKESESISDDYPLELDSRLLSLEKAKSEMNKKTPNTLGAVDLFLNERLSREELTISRILERRNSQLGSRTDVPVYRLRFGTVYLSECATDDSLSQMLFRTGTLHGKVFAWNDELPQEMKKGVCSSIDAAKAGAASAFLPFDLLQNKSVQSSGSFEDGSTWKEAFVKWFKSGGIVMYPLALVAFFALLICLERLITLLWLGRTGKKFLTRFYEFLGKQKYEEAETLCLEKNTCISRVLYNIVRNFPNGRDASERAFQESLLREQPKLEKRMGLLSALGSIAPLLGLLGTVTGIITLFTVITQVGTNDARILAGGISEALVTTEAGLIIAIPVMVIHGFLSEKLEKTINEIYLQSRAALNRLFPKEKN